VNNIKNIIVVVVICGFLIKFCNRQIEMNSWENTTGSLVSYNVEKYRESKSYTTSDGKTKTNWKNAYRVRFSYSFKVDEVKYSGNFKVDNLINTGLVDRAIARYPKGKVINITFDPNNPYDNVFKR
jgi:hypothetical protein